MKESHEIKVGIGFATGRRGFQQVLKTCVYNWNESGLVENKLVSLNLFIAYDLTYNKTKSSDYTNIHKDLVDQLDTIHFIDGAYTAQQMQSLIQENVLTQEEAQLIFTKGYAAKRNAILYNALQQKMDYLIFLDDDEYPLAVTNTKQTAVWGGQHVLPIHLNYLHKSDVTHGHHCGYISPIPYIEFNEKLTEENFKSFIEAISNDIINWENVMEVMGAGGVTYANTEILASIKATEIPETNHAKFISGANLGINLTTPSRVLPFYNPPGARGEDTFLSTCLTDRTVMSVPCYTFHDGFSTYKRLLEGVLPTKLKFNIADNPKIIDRFYKACIGWVRYKPLLTYITQPENYESQILEIQQNLERSLPSICNYFDQPSFMKVLGEFHKYCKHVPQHYDEFQQTKLAWSKIMEHFEK